MKRRRRAFPALIGLLAALAALMAMAFVGVSSATAESTALCKADESPCAEANIITHVHETSVGKATLLASPKIECNVLFLGEVVGEGEVGQAEIEGNFTYTNCGSGCSVTEQSASSVIEVEKTGHETANVVGEGEFHVNCIGINCYYNGEGLVATAKGPLLSTQANGEISLQEQAVHKVKGTFCPGTAKLDITTTPLSATHTSSAHEFISSPEGSGFIGKGGAQTLTLGGHTVTCKSATITGHTTTKLLFMEVENQTCEAFSKSATVAGAAYALTANGLGGIAAEGKMTVTVKPTAESECVYTLPETPEAVSSVSYSNIKAGIVVTSALKGLAYELKETGTSVCGTNGEKSTKGEYKGEVTTESYELVRCVFWGLGGFYYFSGCGFDGGGLWELVSGYSSLKWS
ncbi:MAG TPA: hypothetical protein VFJ64_10935 [Solirubrobacterales bacterium]|nr:hypothetical protein [Solirubrobacterales bacterium]